MAFDRLNGGLGGHIGALFASVDPKLTSGARAALGARHKPAQKRLQVDRQERGFVAPVFEEALGSRRHVRVERRAVVGAQPRKQGKIVRANEHVDAVDLTQAESTDGVRQRAGAEVRGAGQPVEPLRRERDAAGRKRRKFFLQRFPPDSTFSRLIAVTDGRIIPNAKSRRSRFLRAAEIYGRAGCSRPSSASGEII